MNFGSTIANDMRCALAKAKVERSRKRSLYLPGQCRAGWVWSMSSNAVQALVASERSLALDPPSFLDIPIQVDRAVGWCIEWRAL